MFLFRASGAKKPHKSEQGQAKMRIIGIDPGLQRLGWGVIDVEGSRLSHVANGVCESLAREELALRLLSLHRQLTKVVETYQPDLAAVEQTFVNRDGAGTLKLGQARGIAMLVPAQAGLPVAEYAPNAVKKAVVGVGHAEKQQVEHMVRMQLPGAVPAAPMLRMLWRLPFAIPSMHKTRKDWPKQLGQGDDRQIDRTGGLSWHGSCAA